MTTYLKNFRKITLTENMFKFVGPVFLSSVALVVIFSIVEIVWHYSLPTVMQYVIGGPFFLFMIAGAFLLGPLGSMKMDHVSKSNTPHSQKDEFLVRIAIGAASILPGICIVTQISSLPALQQFHDSNSWIEIVGKFILAVLCSMLYTKVVKAIIGTFAKF